MNVTMRDEDRQAVDLVLDRTAMGKAPRYAAAESRIRERVTHVENVLNIFSNLEANEPPRNLLARTIRYVEQSAGCDLSGAKNIEPVLTHNQRHLA